MNRVLGCRGSAYVALLAVLLAAGCGDAGAPGDEPSGDTANVDGVDKDGVQGDTGPDGNVGACTSDADCDGNVATLEVCQAFRCDLESGSCVVGQALDGDLCEDGNGCTEGDACLAGACVGGEAPHCDDDNPCTEDKCDITTGCVSTPNVGPCDDGNPCTDGDVCVDSVCTAGDKTDCDDGNACTSNFCDPADGCQAVALTGAVCDDEDACTTGETCDDEGTCGGGDAVLCDDDNPCTDDSCDAASGCVADDNNLPCDDEDACTTKDLCEDGACVGGEPPVCDDENPCTDDSCDADDGCVATANAEPCDDGLGCTDVDTCLDGACVGAALDCDDGNECTQGGCTEDEGCTQSALVGVFCNDGSKCTVGDVCNADAACVGSPAICNDEDACTDDACDPEFGCVVEDNTAPCDDNDACTTSDACSGGTCQGVAVTCSDGDSCTDDSCQPEAGCVFSANTAPCDDDNACTVNDICGGSGCQGETVDCGDQNPCTATSCEPTQGCHTEALEGAGCDDEDACTTGETCDAFGACGDGSGVVCDDQNPCTDDVCDVQSGCGYTNNTSDCDDGNQCTGGDVCAAGTCVPGANGCDCQVDAECGNDDNLCDGLLFCDLAGDYGPSNTCQNDPTGAVVCNTAGDDACTTTVCTPETGTCAPDIHEGASCDDASACTTGDQCDAGGDCVGQDVVCDDGNGCTNDSCSAATGCVYAHNAAPCDDSNLCTTNDTCADGACVGGAALDCDDGNICTVDACSAGVGCDASPLEGASCSDDDVCTTNAVCNASGECVGGTPTDCDDGNSCTDAGCDAVTGCYPVAKTGEGCNDGDSCTSGDACNSAGACVGQTIQCDDSDACTADSCDSGAGCDFAPLTQGACDDGSACTTNDACDASSDCTGDAVDCDDLNPCTTDGCDPAEGCGYTDVDGCTYCDGGVACPAGDLCEANQCVPDVPDDWTCEDAYFKAGDDCDCECGAYDPDCDDAAAAILGCAPYSVCTAAATCESLPPGCDEYCDKVMANCTGAQTQFDDAADCKTHCADAATWDEGADGATSGNSIACRIYHADAAESDPVSHCGHAGPSGGNVCGGWCDNYCQLSEKNCTGANDFYFGMMTCEMVCATLPTSGSPGDVSGDTVQCRIHNLGLPAHLDADAGCAAGDLDGGTVCVPDDYVEPTCTDFCSDVVTNCTGDNEQFETVDQCDTFCTDAAAWKPGSLDDTAVNSIGCRTYHAGAAEADPATHCAHAGNTGGGTCGSWCDNYCHYAMLNCSGADELYEDKEACYAACAAFPETGEPDDDSGDTVQCRIYHAIVANVAPFVACAAAGPDGGGTCVAPEDIIPSCGTYCSAITDGCTGVDAQYISSNDCLGYCYMSVTWDAGSLADTAVNTLGCRQHWAEEAAEAAPDVNCAYGSASGGGQCGSWCDNYCQLTGDNCTGDNQLFNSDASCLSNCATYPEDGEPGATEGDTVQCRITYAGKAGGFGNVGAVHCDAAAPDGGGVCVTDAEKKELVINEIDYEQVGADTADFVEILNSTGQDAEMSNYTLELVDGSTGTVYDSYDLSLAVEIMGDGDYLVIGSASVVAGLNEGVVYIQTTDDFLQDGSNGGDAVRLVDSDDGSQVDAVAYEANVEAASEGNSNAGKDNGDGSLSRCPDGTDTDDNGADFVVAIVSTAGQTNGCGCGDGVCDALVGEGCQSCEADCGACEQFVCVEWASVKQILDDYGCSGCHSGANPSGGLQLDTPATILVGGNHGPAVVACDPGASNIYTKPSANPPFGFQMPFDNPGAVTPGEMDTILEWIEQGATDTCEEGLCL